jgi:predicted alpha/beta superfamily hydrolase
VSCASRSVVSLAFVSILVFTSWFAFAVDHGHEQITIGHTETFRSAVLNEDREIEVSLPSGFGTSDRAYPLVVVLDGRDLYSYVVSSTAALTPNFFPEMVIVGVRNTDRNRDLDVTGADGADPEAFGAFLKNELIPYLGRQYRASGYRVLMGHSLAGFYAFHTSLHDPALFDASIATSPSLTYEGAESKIEDDFESLDRSAMTGRFFYLSAGGEESEKLRNRIAQLEQRLIDLGIDGLTCETDVFPGEGHFPMKGFYQGLRRVFGDWAPPTAWFTTGSLVDLQEHYERVGAKYGDPGRPPSDLIWSLRNRLDRLDMDEEYLAATEYHVNQYPENLARYLVLVDLYENRSQTDKSIELLERGLAIDPGADQLRLKLDELRGAP